MRKLATISLVLFGTLIGAGVGGFASPASGQIAGACWLYNVNYARRVLGATGGVVDVETVVTLRNPGNAAVPVMIEWIDTTGATVGISGPIALGGLDSTEFATTPAAAVSFPFGVDVGTGAAIPAFEGGARIYRTDAACKASNKLSVNAQVIVDFSGVYPEYIHVKVDRPKGLTGD